MYRIYSLTCPIKNKVVYVGRTKITLDIRLKQHLIASYKVNALKKLWIKDLKKKGLLPIISELDTCAKEEVSSVENKWIKHFFNQNPDLFNIIHL